MVLTVKISKKDALMWFRFFAELPDDQPLLIRQQEIALATFSQIETAVEARRAKLIEGIQGLKTLAGRTYYVGPDDKFPRGCVSCLTGTGLSAVRRTNRCNLNCPFCYNYGELDQIEPIGEGLWEIGGTRLRVEDLDMLFSIQRKPTGVAYVYLEPFMEIELYGPIIRAFRKAGVHQHMYTNGTLCTKENLRMLADSGLDELRFNLGASNCADRVIDSIAMAAEMIPSVGIETPMTPSLNEGFFKKKDRILGTGIRFMNLAELHLNANNLGNYWGENMYVTRLGYLSPVWSRDLTLQLMAVAASEKWDLCVHDCSNMTKLARDLNLRAHEGGWFGASGYGAEFDRWPYEAFLPILEDPSFTFVEEEPLPRGYNPGELY